MLQKFLIIFHQIREALAEGGMSDLLRKRIFRSRVLTPVELELSAVEVPENLLKASDYKFIEFDLNELRAGKLSFAMPSRKHKAFYNLDAGLRGFAVVEDSRVVGDVWCCNPRFCNRCVIYDDIEMLDFKCNEGEVYAFDMYIDPTSRGKNLAVPLQRCLQSTLKEEGYERVYGYYWDDQLPAMWMHRMLRFKELPKRRVDRFFFVRKSEEVVRPPAIVPCWEFLQCTEECTATCPAHQQRHLACWELFCEDGSISESCLSCDYYATVHKENDKVAARQR
jgi:hypothetical protein